MKSTLRRFSALALAFCLSLSLAACSSGDPAAVQSRFDDFTQEMFLGTMQSDFTSSVYFVEHPENYGFDRSQMEVSVGLEETDENFREAAKQADATLDALRRFDRSVLTAEQQDTYDLLEWSYTLSQKSYEDRFRYYGSYFSNLSGVHTNLLTSLSEMQIQSESDLAMIPALLESIPGYIDSLLEYTRRQQEEKVLTIDFDSVIDVCDTTVDQGEDSAVLKNLLAQAEGLGLDDQAVARYQSEIRTAYLENFIPSYQKIADTMRDLENGYNNTEGLAALPEGRDYYEILFAAGTALDETPDEVRDMAETRLQRIISRLGGLAYLYPDSYNGWMEGNYKTSFDSYEEMLEYLDLVTDRDFPDVGKLSYVIDPIPSDVANSGVAAYFVTPAVDESGPMRIRVNTQNTVDLQALSTFTTLAHEGIPGHMYASEYSYQNLQSDLRKVLTTQTGYNEGYATYVELLSLDYLQNQEIPNEVLEMERLNTELSNCLVTIMDISINYDGMTRDEFADAFGSYIDPAYASYYYDLMRLEPTAYLSYYAGWLKLESLRDQAEKDLGDSFDALGFHTAILQSGSVPYFIVERNVNAWVEEVKEAMSGVPAREGEAESESALAA